MGFVRCERDGDVGVITLDDPSSLNAMSPSLMDELAAAIEAESADGAARALVLTGAGRGFCSGQNLKSQESLGPDLVAGVMRHYFPVFRGLRECRVPVIAAVNGVAAGGGFSLALACDAILAAQSASFIQVFSRIALVPDLGSTWTLPHLVGRQRALSLMLSNQPLPAAVAKEWGVVLDVVADERLMAEAMGLARKLAEGPTRTLVATRRLVDEGMDNSFEAQFRRELEVQQVIRQSPDAKEGVAAFVERRKARFTGR
ncbi:enoyl-CoA hydratase-related protein [Desertibaculum subflavum]|uniref:enoyl-CoA hydratase-related protein n=1 Tax=Desertibaculum subflavum TaxID=2268458 RepID=UPI000E65F889